MLSRSQSIETAVCGRLGCRTPAGRVERITFWLVPVLLLAFVVCWLPGVLRAPGELLLFVTLPLFFVLLMVQVFRWISKRVLWAVRGRIILTCLLMGLAPVVLFGSLTAATAYLFAGQFATDTALTGLQGSLEQVRDRVASYGAPAARALELDGHAGLRSLPAPPLANPLSASKQLHVAAWQDGRALPVEAMAGGGKPGPFALPAPPVWLRPGFSGVVQNRGRLYLVATAGYQNLQHTILVLCSVPLEHDQLSTIAHSLGSVRVLPLHGNKGAAGRKLHTNFEPVQGGVLARPAHFYDTRVFFSAPLPVIDWQTGANTQAFLGVASRPTLLYARLFSSSVRVGAIIRDALVSLGVLFVLLQMLALYMAVRLSRTITRSVAALYQGTLEIDRGHLAHRVPVERQDQLGALATSFNTMTRSLAHLLAAQREQERLKGELAIAQEVQKNLFPHTPVRVPGFELHGICKPARTVSGDYYDFILNSEEQLSIAIGDISGKGISAALLMASLHSAVRAYVLPASDASIPTPGEMLALLNRHLYTSTQPEKYATLFFASYCSETRELVYANGGQLPPLLLASDGTTQALERGGSVVGLLDGMQYDEGRVQLHAGDLLVAYSDGVTEPENDFGEFGVDRLLAVVRRHRRQPLSEISSHVMRELANWIGDGEQPDDITLVLVRQG